MHAQQPDDHFLEKLLQDHATPFLNDILAKPEIYRYQLIYTRIDRDKNNVPVFTNYNLHTDRELYFNPASTVKLPVALLALEKLHQLGIYDVDKYTAMLTDSSYSGQTSVHTDSTAANGLPSVAHYIRKIFLVSDNDAYNRLYEFIGQQTIHEKLWAKGFKDVRITRRFVPMSEEENRHTNKIRFIKNDQVVYEQPAAFNPVAFDFSKKIFIGNAHYNREEELVNTPMDFTRHNNAPLEDLRLMLQSVLFPESVPKENRFDLSADDYTFLYRYMSMLPSESDEPVYDGKEFFDSYTKFFFKADKAAVPAHIRIFNKPGWSYGFLTDVAYVVDFTNRVEYMLSASIYVNSDGILNDNKYEYDSIGYPFFKEINQIIYQDEMKRKRNHFPDLRRFQINYKD